MPDPRIIDYIRQNAGKYPIESLKQALVKQGFSSQDVEEAAGIATGQAPPPPAPAAPEAPQSGMPAGGGTATPETVPQEGYVVFSPQNLIANAKALFQEPEAFFSRIDPKGPMGPAVVNLLLWAVISGFILGLIGFLVPAGMFGKAAALAQIIVFPVMAVIFSFIGAAVYHVVCLILGGKAPFRGSYQVISGLSALFPVSSVIGVIPFGNIPVQLYGLYLSVQSAAGVHKIAKKKAWIVFGILTALGIIGSITFTMQARKLQQMASSGQFPGMMGAPTASPAGGGMPGLGDPAAADKMRRMMDQAMQDPGAVLQKLGRYSAMEEPPEETLALLDDETADRLLEIWPRMGAPIRQSLVENLPSIPRESRGDFIERTATASQSVNKAFDQSMQLLQQVMESQEQPK
ncbi:MAG: Yip1 family protein [Elusimicrobiota bacterium]